MSFSRFRGTVAGVLALSVVSAAFARQLYGVTEIDCASLLEAGAPAEISLTAAGSNTGTVTVSSIPENVISWSGTPTWDSNNHATIYASVASDYIGFAILTASSSSGGVSRRVSIATLILDQGG